MKKQLWISIALIGLLSSACVHTSQHRVNTTTKSQDNIPRDTVNAQLRDDKGQILEITFDNSSNSAKIKLNGAEPIILEGQRAASGIWYKNERYELRGKGQQVSLSKDGQVLFEN